MTDSVVGSRDLNVKSFHIKTGRCEVEEVPFIYHWWGKHHSWSLGKRNEYPEGVRFIFFFNVKMAGGSRE